MKHVFHQKYPSNINQRVATKRAPDSYKAVLKQDPLHPPLLAKLCCWQVHLLFQDLGFPTTFSTVKRTVQRDNFVSYKCLDTLTNHIPNTGYPHPSQTLKDHQPPGSLLALSPLELETPPVPEGTTASLSWYRPRPSHSSSTWVILHVFELYTHWGHTVFSLASVNILSGG